MAKLKYSGFESRGGSSALFAKSKLIKLQGIELTDHEARNPGIRDNIE